ncbi:DUF4339 domain-containing protein [Bacillus sp. NP157]|nr:DUF4339 domain-containing protein [Bacillus sp. NP157]
MEGAGYIWLGDPDGRKQAYGEDVLRDGIAHGKVDAAALAWREGMAGWQPLYRVLGMAAPAGLPGTDVEGEQALRDALPEPPGLHWTWLLLLIVATLGFGGLAWGFVQARWIRRIDPANKAAWLLAIAAPCWAIHLYYLSTLPWVAPPLPPLGLMLLEVPAAMGGTACVLLAWFAMARSLRRRLPAYGLVPDIDSAYVIFFNVLYIQGQLRWIRRWRHTGDTLPRPPRLILWLVMAVACVGLVALQVANTIRMAREMAPVPAPHAVRQCPRPSPSHSAPTTRPPHPDR